MSEELLFSIGFSAIGITIVFAVLAIIAIVINYLSKAESHFANKKEQEGPQPVEQKTEIDNITLILLTAAAATMIEGRFFIKKVRKLLPANHITSPWHHQGLAILHGSHVIKKK